jgi:hypothetical protein
VLVKSNKELANACGMSGTFIKRAVTVRPPERRTPDRSSWPATLVLSVLLIVPIALMVLVAHTANRISHPSEEELIAIFISHEADFEELAQMLDSDRARLLLGGETVELSELGTTGVSPPRIGHYDSLLRKIGVKSFRYFPRSGNIILPVSDTGDSRPGCSKSYRYLPRAQPEPLGYHRGYAWRGPGIYILTGDRRIKGQWFVHHDTTLGIGFSPY